MEKVFIYFLYFILSIPTIGFGLLVTLVTRVIFYVGHIPSYGTPDPKDVDMDIHLEITRLFILLSILLLPFTPFILLLTSLFIKRNNNIDYIFMTIIIMWFILNPFIKDWLFD